MKRLPDFKSPDGGDGIVSSIVYFCRFSWMNPQKVLYSLLWIGLVGCGYAAYETFPGLETYAFLTLATVYTIVVVLALLNLQSHIADERQRTEEPRPDATETDLESKHFICTDPWDCGRCWGYYAGLSITVTSSLELHQYLVSSFEELGMNPWIAILLGFGLFILTTPIHGAIGSVMRTLLSEPQYEMTTSSNTLKFITGFLSGLSLLLALVGSLILLPK